MKTLSPKPKQILAFLRRFREEKDYPPTIRDIVKACGISSTSVVDYNLEILGGSQKRLVRVPIIGYIAAGEPIPVPTSDTWEAEPLDTVEVSSELVKGRGDVYALRIKGNSMVDALISDGDIVLMQQAETADNGEMVAAWLKAECETTLKKLYRERDQIRLQPANAQMKPIYANPKNVEVQGKVIGVIRQLAVA
jgi:repressor LexA